MASLQQRLDEFKKSFKSGAPLYNATREAIEKMHRATAELEASGILDRALRSRSELHAIQSRASTGSLERSFARRTAGGRFLPRPLVTLLQHGAGGSTGNPF
jgi:hypothetical protein